MALSQWIDNNQKYNLKNINKILSFNVTFTIFIHSNETYHSSDINLLNQIIKSSFHIDKNINISIIISFNLLTYFSKLFLRKKCWDCLIFFYKWNLTFHNYLLCRIKIIKINRYNRLLTYTSKTMLLLLISFNYLITIAFEVLFFIC